MCLDPGTESNQIIIAKIPKLDYKKTELKHFTMAYFSDTCNTISVRHATVAGHRAVSLEHDRPLDRQS